MGRRAALAALLALAGVFYVGNSTAAGQVVIDMPPPKPRPRYVEPPPAPPEAATPATVIAAPRTFADLDPGSLAMHRYARARTLPDHARIPWRHRPFHPSDFTHWSFWHPFPVITTTKIILVE